MELTPICCWQPTIEDHALLIDAQRLYENSIDAVERIPWAWIERAVIEPIGWNGWHKHLLLASVGGSLAGLGYGSYIPGFGAYLGYVTVAAEHRRLGVASQLFDEFLIRVHDDARQAGESLPFVAWDSCRPGEECGAAGRKLWQARVRLFAAMGGLWVKGVQLMAPSYHDPTAALVPLQVFLKPLEEPRASFRTRRLRQVIEGLLLHVYGRTRDDACWSATFRSATRLRLVQPKRSVMRAARPIRQT